MRRNQKGFSLIELMMSVAILGLIVVGLVNIFGGGLKMFFFEKDMINIQQNARVAMNLMVREFREIGDGVEENYGDRIDNDGDNRIDEELPNAQDDDGDTRIDEDMCGKIAYANPDSIRFLIGSERDELPKIITYYLGTNTTTRNLQLMKAIEDTSTTKIVALTRADVRVSAKHGTNSTLFQYTLANGTKTTNPTDEQLHQIRLITITLQVQVGTGTTTKEVTLVSQVKLRNL
ncbi:MAG: prepilin-type N-terminal cleavage/methylation domain-containing protein [Nitrospirota bacterium]